MFWKRLTQPVSNETTQTESVQLWEVRWHSRYSEYSGGVRPEMEAFPSEAEAKHFATALRNAFRLIRHTSGTDVEITKAEQL